MKVTCTLSIKKVKVPLVKMVLFAAPKSQARLLVKQLVH